MLFLLQIISNKITQYVALAIGILSAIAAIRRSGKMEERNSYLQKDVQDIAKKNEVINAVNRMSNDDVDKQLQSNWKRD